MFGSPVHLGNQIEEWEEINPNEVHQVPVETYVIDRPKILAVELIPSCLNDQPSDHKHPTENVNRVNSGHAVVDAEKQPALPF